MTSDTGTAVERGLGTMPVETPRTDALSEYSYWGEDSYKAAVDRLIAFARGLERELIAATRERERFQHDREEERRLRKAAEAALEGLKEDAERWRKHEEMQRWARIPGALYVRLTMQPEASEMPKVWETEYVFDTLRFGQSTMLGLKAIGLSVEKKAEELFAAIDASREQGRKG